MHGSSRSKYGANSPMKDFVTPSVRSSGRGSSSVRKDVRGGQETWNSRQNADSLLGSTVANKELVKGAKVAESIIVARSDHDDEKKFI